MRKITSGILVSLCLLLSAFTVLQNINYQVRNGFIVSFKNSELSGSFSKLKGNIAFNENHLEQSVFDMIVEVSSIKTGNFLKNMHAKGSDWFDADHYPNIRFISGNFEKKGSNYIVTGTLELHGVKKQVGIPFTFTNNVFAGDFTINRLEFKVGDMKGMSAKVPADLHISLFVPVIEK